MDFTNALAHLIQENNRNTDLVGKFLYAIIFIDVGIGASKASIFKSTFKKIDIKANTNSVSIDSDRNITININDISSKTIVQTKGKTIL